MKNKHVKAEEEQWWNSLRAPEWREGWIHSALATLYAKQNLSLFPLKELNMHGYD